MDRVKARIITAMVPVGYPLELPPNVRFLNSEYIEADADRVPSALLTLCVEAATPEEASTLVADISKAAQSFVAAKQGKPAVVFTRKDGTPFPTLQEIEAQHIREAMQLYEGNKQRAAAALGISRETLYQKLKSLRLA